MLCRCTCHETVSASKVAETGRFNCMVFKLDTHQAKLPSNHTTCRAAGAFIALHPHSLEKFKQVLEALGFRDYRILIPLHGAEPQLV